MAGRARLQELFSRGFRVPVRGNFLNPPVKDSIKSQSPFCFAISFGFAVGVTQRSGSLRGFCGRGNARIPRPYKPHTSPYTRHVSPKA